MKNITLVILTFFFMALCAFSEEIPQHPGKFYADQTQDLVYTNAGGEWISYRLFLPKDYDAAKKYPLVLVFHGAGQRGYDNRKQLAPYTAGWIDDAVQSKHPCILVIPQCPVKQDWVDFEWAKRTYSFAAIKISKSMRLTKELLDQVMREKSVDPNRVYVLGASMGGYGAWNFVMHYPALVAAAVPVCGGGDPAMAETIKQVPIWAFHGDNDNIVPPWGTQNMVDAIKKAGGTKIKLTMYPEVSHDACMKAWREPELVEWLFSQSKTNSVESK